jgi:hypothetical protein
MGGGEMLDILRSPQNKNPDGNPGLGTFFFTPGGLQAVLNTVATSRYGFSKGRSVRRH